MNTEAKYTENDLYQYNISTLMMTWLGSGRSIHQVSLCVYTEILYFLYETANFSQTNEQS